VRGWRGMTGKWSYPKAQTLRREHCHVRSYTSKVCLFHGMRWPGFLLLRAAPEVPAEGDGSVSQHMLAISDTSVHMCAMM
jgi:hypothetical protein